MRTFPLQYVSSISSGQGRPERVLYAGDGFPLFRYFSALAYYGNQGDAPGDVYP